MTLGFTPLNSDKTEVVFVKSSPLEGNTGSQLLPGINSKQSLKNVTKGLASDRM